MELPTRQVAYKVWVSDLIRGKFVQTEGDFEPNYFEVGTIRVARTNLVGTVINKFVREDNQYISLTIDDGSASIDVRAWNEDVELLDGYNIGDFIIVIGRARMFNDSAYILPEITRKLSDYAWLRLRRFELLKLWGEPVKTVAETLIKVEPVKFGDINIIEERVFEEELSGREGVLSAIESNDSGAGVGVDIISKNVKIDEEKIEAVLNDLLKDGEIFEVEKGLYRVLP